MRHDLVEGLISTVFLYSVYIMCGILWAIGLITIPTFVFFMLGALAVMTLCSVHDKHGEHFHKRTKNPN